MKDPQRFYAEQVWPQMPEELKAGLVARYPNVRLNAEAGFQPLAEIPTCMLIGLTGTGKSTALKALDALRQSGSVQYCDDIPSRRALADWVLVPAAQVIGGEPVVPVIERTERFRLTRRFAQEIEPGGSAAVYGWLHYRGSGPLLSEALRGPREIAYALAHYPHWYMVELWVDPVIRLQRLSQRRDAFDQVDTAGAPADLDFLPPEQRATVETMLAAGSISLDALVTARTEAESYGSEPYDRHNRTEHYRCIVIDELEPEDVAGKIAQSLKAPCP